jgi:hypothetical protein
MPGPVHIVRVNQSFTLNLLSGERLTLPPGSIVALPCSQEETLSRLRPQVMVGLFICSSYAVESELTSSPTTPTSATTSSSGGLSAANEDSPTTLPEYDDDQVPF